MFGATISLDRRLERERKTDGARLGAVCNRFMAAS
jgi:hypothetical protein